MKNKIKAIIHLLVLFCIFGTTVAQQNNRPLKYKTRKSDGSEPQPPVLFLMHGYGGNKKQFDKAMKIIDDRFLIVSLNAPSGKFLRLTNWWYEFSISNGDTSSNQEQIDHSVDRILFTMNDIKEKYNYDLGRVYIGGYSQGAIMAYKLALLYPETFAGVVIHSARLPVKYSPRSPSTLYENMDMLIIHGKNDGVLTTKWANKGVNLFVRLGSDVDYFEGDFGHERTEESILQMSRWLKEKIDEK